MVRKMLWTEDAGRRVKLRDLHVFLSAARSGSMAQAAKKLGVSQPTISEAIADLEGTFGVKLLDRTSRGVEPTIFGEALMRRAVAAFDELKQGSLDIAFLANSGQGESADRVPEIAIPGAGRASHPAVRAAISSRCSADGQSSIGRAANFRAARPPLRLYAGLAGHAHSRRE